MSDTNERSVVASVEIYIDTSACGLPESRPLRRPVPTLTDAEREALERVSVAYGMLPTAGARQAAATFRGLLERLK